MHRRPPALLAALLVALGPPAAWASARPAEDEPTEAEVLFALEVRPLLAGRCFACHGEDPEAIKGGLDLTSREGMLRGGDIQGPAIEPGDAELSPLYWAVTRTEPGLEMPPKEADALTEEQTWLVRDWIDGGAPWPPDDRVARIVAEYAEGVVVPTSGGLSGEWTDRRYAPEDLWAYRPVERPAVPAPDGALPAANPIDAFVNRRLGELGLSPAPRADRRTLIRRATFDLLGLPPTPGEIDAFLDDPRPDREAFASVVDRLLASPHHGEAWGRHWLDVARYADSAGFANDYERPNAWRYRDYVARAFNEDTPFDVFIREQIAGDEIAPGDTEALVAAGFLRMGPWEHTGMSVAKVTRQQFLDDVTDLVGQAFLGHPLQCARCHDHKFDPVPTRDYYAVQAVFATAQFADREAPFLPEENTASGADERGYLEQRIGHYQDLLASINRKAEEAALAWYAERGLDYAPRQKKFEQGVPADEIAPKNHGLTPEDMGLERIARKYLERHRWELDRYDPIALSLYSGPTRTPRGVYGRITMPEDPAKGGTLEQTAILAGGDVFAPTDPVAPGALSAVPLTDDPDASSPLPEIPATVSGRRAAFAEWVASPGNPLTPRVAVNRLWQWHFGRGLVATPNNFGTKGSKPTHPELLDWLAAEFVASGWSVKAIHRLILGSEAYARSSAHPDPEALAARDPKGEALARFRPRRVSAEELRDAMLAASGELNRAIGGVPTRPDMNMEAALQPRQVMGTYAPTYQPSPRRGQRNRRTLYAAVLRGQRDPFLAVFNQPSPDEPCDGRASSTVAPQALSLLNGREPYDRALALADRLLRETDSRPGAVRRLFLLTTGREPSEADLADCLAHWEAMADRHRGLSFEPREVPLEVTRSAVDENSGETFAFTEPLESYRDYEPDVRPGDLDPEARALADLCLVLLNSNAFLTVD